MSLQKIYELLGPFMFFVPLIVIFFPIGVWWAACLWRTRSRRYANAMADLDSYADEIKILESENQALEKDLLRRERVGRSNGHARSPDLKKAQHLYGGESQAESDLHTALAAGAEVEWESIEGIRPEIATELNHLGIKNFEQLESLSQEERDVVEAKLSFEGQPWDWGKLNAWKTAAAAKPGLLKHNETDQGQVDHSGANKWSTVELDTPELVKQ